MLISDMLACDQNSCPVSTKMTLNLPVYQPAMQTVSLSMTDVRLLIVTCCKIMIDYTGNRLTTNYRKSDVHLRTSRPRAPSAICRISSEGKCDSVIAMYLSLYSAFTVGYITLKALRNGVTYRVIVM